MQLYGKAGDRYPIKSGEIWGLGGHILACGDIDHSEAISFVKKYSPVKMVYIDPPYNLALAKGFRTNAGLDNNVDFEKFLIRLLEATREACTGDVFMEMGVKQAEFFCKLIENMGGAIQNIWEITYYKTKPAILIHFSFVNPTYLKESPTGMDDSETPTWAIERCSAEGDFVLDLCMGLGCTAVSAHRLGRFSLGFELHPRRLARTIESLVKMGLGEPILIGKL